MVRLPGQSELIPLETVTVVSPSSVVKPVEKTVEKPEILGESSFENEIHQTPSQLELLHHPSYQEQGNASNATRRRRRQSQPQLKDESTTKVIPNIVVKESDYLGEIEAEPRKERGHRHLRREEIPMEKVSVEMTPLEQDLYALMGVSPLVCLDREFKDPKSVLVSVKFSEHLVNMSNTQEIRKEQEIQEVKEEAEIFCGDTSFVISQSISPKVSEFSDNDEKTDDKETSTKLPESDSERPVIRRRRRRSSAKEA
jgi:ribonuclease E